MRTPLQALVVAALLSTAAAARADVWDTQTQSDNTVATENELVHGSDQRHDLGALPGPAADEDWYRLRQAPRSSYEAVVEAAGAEVLPTWELQLLRFGSQVVADSAAAGAGQARSLRFRNTSSVVIDDQHVRVRSAGCTTSCTAGDAYRIRFRETTLSVPRFNNSGSQRTVLILRSQAGDPIAGTVYFWREPGTLVGITGTPFTLPARATIVLDTSSLEGLAGQSGAITIAHDGGYGSLSGKSVAVEPATGFSFDSPLLPRAY
jgi:hypothetical protein